MNNLLSYCESIDARMSASDKDLPVQLEVPYLATDGDYDLEGYVSYFPVYGKDYMYMKLNNVTLNAHAKLLFDVSGSYLKLTNLTLDGDFENGEVFFYNLNWVGKIINYFVDVKSLWNAMKSFVFRRLNKTLTTLINHEMDKCDIIGIIAGDCIDSSDDVNVNITETLHNNMGTHVNNQPFDLYLKSILSNFSSIMETGYPEIGVPILDPFHVPDFDIPQIANTLINTNITIDNLIVTNLSTFDVVLLDTDFTNLSMSLQLRIPMLR